MVMVMEMDLLGGFVPFALEPLAEKEEQEGVTGLSVCATALVMILGPMPDLNFCVVFLVGQGLFLRLGLYSGVQFAVFSEPLGCLAAGLASTMGLVTELVLDLSVHIVAAVVVTAAMAAVFLMVALARMEQKRRWSLSTGSSSSSSSPSYWSAPGTPVQLAASCDS